MKTKRILCAVLAVVMLTAALAGCSAPKLTLGGTAKTAATVGDKTFSTGEYLAFLYNDFYNIFYGQGLYQYAQYGMDVWEQQKFPYGEGDDAEELPLEDYIKRTAQDTITRQVALEQLMDKYGIKWDEEKEKEMDESLKELTDDMYIDLGFSNENFISSYKRVGLNEGSLFLGLYGKGGQKEVPEADKKTYFKDNFVSYKIISEQMTDSEGAELDEAGQKEVKDELNGYLDQYNKSKDFEKVMDAYTAAHQTGETAAEPSTDENNRVTVDSTNDAVDAKLMEAVKGIEVGKASVVTYKANDTTLTAALIVRLDPNEPASLFEDRDEDILYGMKYEEFDKEVKDAVAALKADFNKSVIKKCSPKNFVEQ